MLIPPRVRGGGAARSDVTEGQVYDQQRRVRTRPYRGICHRIAEV
jgi:hypothetical protein